MARKTKVSDLNRRILIQEKRTITDTEGIGTEGWVDFVTVWAAREPLIAGASDFFSAAAINAEKTVRYKIRYRPGILANMRLLDRSDGKTYSIKTPLDDVFGDRTETHIIAEVMEDG